MAHVPMSAELRRLIVASVSKLCDTEIAMARQGFSKISVQEAYALALPNKELREKAALHPDITPKIRSFAVSYSSKGHSHRLDYACNLHVPNSFSETYTHVVRAENLPPDHPARSILDEYGTAVENKDTLIKGISELMASCTTLRQLLEKWPGAEEHIPPEYLQRLRAPSTRAKREEDPNAPQSLTDEQKVLLARAKITYNPGVT